MVCTPAFESFSEQVLETPAAPVTIPDAFSASDGPAPYTVADAAFMNLQLPLQGLTFAPSGGNTYALSAGITPMVRVTYFDGNNTLRTKLVQAHMQLAGTVSSQVAPETLNWWAFLDSGSISNPITAGTTLSFTASAAVAVISLSDTPGNYAVLRDFTCSQQAPVQAVCRRISALESYCRLSGVIPGSSQIAIPFAPIGPAPYSNPSASPLGGPPYVLRVSPQDAGVTVIDLAFPITLGYTDGNDQRQAQPTFLYMSLLMAGVAAAPNTRILADLAVPTIIPSANVTPPALTLETVVLVGSIAAVNDPVSVPVTEAVQCGEAPVSACQPILPPPTQEITG